MYVHLHACASVCLGVCVSMCLCVQLLKTTQAIIFLHYIPHPLVLPHSPPPLYQWRTRQTICSCSCNTTNNGGYDIDIVLLWIHRKISMNELSSESAKLFHKSSHKISTANSWIISSEYNVTQNSLRNFFLNTYLYCFVRCLSMIVWIQAALDVLYACFLYFYFCTCSAQLSMFHMERRSRNTLIIIIVINHVTEYSCYKAKEY